MVLRPVVRRRTKNSVIAADSSQKQIAANTVHAELSAFFRAYSIFRPVLPNELNLFQVVLINSSANLRAKSPQKTVANLETIFSRPPVPARNSSFGSIDSEVVQDFRNHFRQTSSFDGKNCSRPPSGVMTVTESSLTNAGVSVAIPTVSRIGVGYSAEKQRIRRLKVHDITSEEYNGGAGLKQLIWRHAETVFRLILLELDMRLGVAVGDRSMAAIITKKILATIGILRTRDNATSVGMHSSGPSSSVMGSVGFTNIDHFEETYDHSGVSAIHFILFPVEKVDRHKWRFYRGIDVCDADLDDNDSHSYEARQSYPNIAKAWHQNEDSCYPEISDYADVSDSSSSCEASTRISSAFSVGSKDVVIPDLGCSSIDVQIHPHELSQFASEQCLIASRYRKRPNAREVESAHTICLLRSALRKCCYEPTVRALYDLSKCYSEGFGVEQQPKTGKVLSYCARSLRRTFNSRVFYFSILFSDSCFQSSKIPEVRLVEILSANGWPLRAQVLQIRTGEMQCSYNCNGDTPDVDSEYATCRLGSSYKVESSSFCMSVHLSDECRTRCPHDQKRILETTSSPCKEFRPHPEIELRFSARNLENGSSYESVRPFLIIHEQKHGSPTNYIGRTEVAPDDCNPFWTTTFSFCDIGDRATTCWVIDLFGSKSNSNELPSPDSFLGRALVCMSTLIVCPYMHNEVNLVSPAEISFESNVKIAARSAIENASLGTVLNQGLPRNMTGTLSAYAERLSEFEGRTIVFRVSSAMSENVSSLMRGVRLFYQFERVRQTKDGCEWCCVHRSEDRIVEGSGEDLAFDDYFVNERELHNRQPTRGLKIAFYRRCSGFQQEMSYVSTSTAELLRLMPGAVIPLKSKLVEEKDLGNVRICNGHSRNAKVTHIHLHACHFRPRRSAPAYRGEDSPPKHESSGKAIEHLKEEVEEFVLPSLHEEDTETPYVGRGEDQLEEVETEGGTRKADYRSEDIGRASIGEDSAQSITDSAEQDRNEDEQSDCSSAASFALEDQDMNESDQDTGRARFTCNSCNVATPIAEAISADPCGHTFCPMCFKNYLVNVALEVNMFPLPCIVCHMALDPISCLNLFRDEPGLYELLANYVAQRHQQPNSQKLQTEGTELSGLNMEETSRGRLATCASCMDEFTVTRSPMTCGHTFCTSCLHRYLQILSTEKEHFPPCCPICRTPLDRDECMISLQNNPELRQEFEMYTVYKQHINQLCYCANPKCGIPFDWSSNNDGKCASLRFTVSCPVCKMHTCVRCKKIRALDDPCVSCLDVDITNLAATSGWRQCPECGVLISKQGGCDFVECRCGRTFNYYESRSTDDSLS